MGRKSIPSAAFEPMVTAIERLEIDALEIRPTGFGLLFLLTAPFRMSKERNMVTAELGRGWRRDVTDNGEEERTVLEKV
jgi:hypothetical protein